MRFGNDSRRLSRLWLADVAYVHLSLSHMRARVLTAVALGYLGSSLALRLITASVLLRIILNIGHALIFE